MRAREEGDGGCGGERLWASVQTTQEAWTAVSGMMVVGRGGEEGWLRRRELSAEREQSMDHTRIATCDQTNEEGTTVRRQNTVQSRVQ